MFPKFGLTFPKKWLHIGWGKTWGRPCVLEKLGVRPCVLTGKRQGWPHAFCTLFDPTLFSRFSQKARPDPTLFSPWTSAFAMMKLARQRMRPRYCSKSFCLPTPGEWSTAATSNKPAGRTWCSWRCPGTARRTSPRRYRGQRYRGQADPIGPGLTHRSVCIGRTILGAPDRSPTPC